MRRLRMKLDSKRLEALDAHEAVKSVGLFVSVCVVLRLSRVQHHLQAETAGMDSSTPVNL